MMFLSGVSGLGAFDADYVREQMRLRASGQKADIQIGVSVADALARESGGIRAGVSAADEAVRAAIRDRVAAQVAARQKQKNTMLIAGGVGVALLALFAMKG